MNTKQLECFINVAQVLNFSKAAQRMFVSQPTVTNQIKSLEDELEVTLFQRTKKSVLLTSAGEEFYNDAQEILTRFSMSKARMRDTQKKYQAKVSIGLTVNTFERKCLPAFIAEFNQQHPEIYLFLQKFDHKAGMQNLIDHKIDVLLFNTEENIDNKDIEVKTIFSDHFCVLSHRNNPLSHLVKITLADLNDQTILLPEKVFRRFEFQQLILFIQLNIPIKKIQYCNDIELAKLMVQSGLGITIVPLFEVYNQQKDFSIISLEVPDKIKQPNYGIAWDKRKLRPEIKLFIKQLELYLNRVCDSEKM